MLNIYLDDIREPPQDGRDWVIVRTGQACIDLLTALFAQEKVYIDTLSLDHDLGERNSAFEEEVLTGYDVAVWLEEQTQQFVLIRRLPAYILCHSANPVGRKRILQVIDQINKFRQHP